MRLLNKKPLFLTLFGLGLFLLFSLNSQPALAISPNVSQAKAPGASTVYYLSQKFHVKKAYVNSDAYFSYNSSWSAVKTVSAAELALWPDAKLGKAPGTAVIYYFQGREKTPIASLSDLINFGLSGVPVLTMSAIDLAQYQTVDYAAIGLTSDNNETGSENNNGNIDNNGNSEPPVGTLTITSEAVTGANNNDLVSGTEGNLLGVFHFQPSDTATITDLTLDFSGLYTSDLLQDVFLTDGNGNAITANVHVNTGSRQALVHFRPALVLNGGSAQTIQVMAGIGSCATNCNNQTISVALKQAASVAASVPLSAVWPLQGTTFTIVNGTMIGQLTSQSESLAAQNRSINNGTRLISKFRLTETTGREDVIVKQIIFENDGTADNLDWDNLRLMSGSTVVSNLADVNDDGQIIFNVNYLLVPANANVELSVLASLKSDYHPANTYNLQMTGLWSVGKAYNLSLTPVINNISETYPLN